MPFLTVNGLELEVLDEQADERNDSVESWERSAGFALTGTTYARKRKWTVQTPPLTLAEAQAYIGWVQGLGHYWSFDYPYLKYSTEGGVAPTLGGSSAVSTSTPKFGTRCLNVASGQNCVFPTSFSDTDMTWALWKRPSSGSGSGTYNHFAQVRGSSNTSYVDGSPASISSWFSVSSGDLTIQGEDNAASAAEARYDEILIVPYQMTADMVAALAARTSAIVPFPFVSVAGDMIPEAAGVTCKGLYTGSEYLQAALGGTFQSNLRRVTFDLIEV